MSPQRCLRSARQLSRSAFAKSTNPVRPSRSADQDQSQSTKVRPNRTPVTGKPPAIKRHHPSGSGIWTRIPGPLRFQTWPRFDRPAYDRTGSVRPHPHDDGEGPITLTAQAPWPLYRPTADAGVAL